MPFNPRRDKRPPAPPPVDITDAQIAAAMERAVALRRRNAVRPERVRAQPMFAQDAVRATEDCRTSYHYRIAQARGLAPDPWWWIGWVHQEEPSPWPPPPGCRPYNRTWAVWLNVDDGRVWLRWERHVAATDPGDPYP